uniref:Uncharacterized protein n=1 Tax=Coleochaete scutata TaxID=3125 RepID=A0A5P9NXE0_COLSC|nr:hypothetical protein [Coleochaete scutata]QFU80117.1 hypothetical protein [Coleochaete scutata]
MSIKKYFPSFPGTPYLVALFKSLAFRMIFVGSCLEILSAIDFNLIGLTLNDNDIVPKRPHDHSNTVCVHDFNEKLNALGKTLRHTGTLIGGGYAVKTIISAVPTPLGKTIVGAVGAMGLVLSPAIEGIFKNPKPPRGGSALVSFFSHAPLSGADLEVVNLCRWVGPIVVDCILVLLGALLAEFARKSLFKWASENKYVPSLLRNLLAFSQSNASRTISLFYVAVICGLLFLNLTYLLIVFNALSDIYQGDASYSRATTLTSVCYIPAILITLEVFKGEILNLFFVKSEFFKSFFVRSKFLKSFFVSKQPYNPKPPRISYIVILIISLIIIVFYLLSILVTL